VLAAVSAAAVPVHEELHRTHVLFNNCYRDYAQVNAQGLTDLLRS
jgi:hypothetical protein